MCIKEKSYTIKILLVLPFKVSRTNKLIMNSLISIIHNEMNQEYALLSSSAGAYSQKWLHGLESCD
jgi:hypothetical protein